MEQVAAAAEPAEPAKKARQKSAKAAAATVETKAALIVPAAPDALAIISDRALPNGSKEKVAVIDADYVRKAVASIVKDQDLSRYIL